MKRTCETCALGCTAPFAYTNHPACENYELDSMDFNDAFEESLAKAREKHPDFVPSPGPELAESFAKDAKWHADAVPCLRNVLLSEVYEFLAEVANGDFDRALEEAGDVVAVLYRALNGEGKQEDKS